MADNVTRTQADDKTGTPQTAAAGTPLSAATEISQNANMQSSSSNSPHADTKIVGRWGKYDSGFWKVAIPMLSVRYFGRYASSLLILDRNENTTIFKPIINFLHRGERSDNPMFVRRLYGTLVATVMASVTVLYANRTFEDMKTMFGETVGWEFNKKPQDVTLKDMWQSKNAIVSTTVRNYARYNARRLAMTSLPFLNFLVPGIKNQIENKANTKFDIYGSVDLGVGTTGAYLVSDVITRKESFFERLQSFTDRKINQSDGVGQKVTAADLINLYEIHARALDPKHSLTGEMGTPAWERDQALFSRMATLMNETYGNSPNTDGANFTIPKFIALLGQDLVKSDNLEKNLLYVEVASKYGMDAVKDITSTMAQDSDLSRITKKYPITAPIAIDAAVVQDAVPASPGFADRVGEPKKLDALLNAAAQTNFVTKAEQSKAKTYPLAV